MPGGSAADETLGREEERYRSIVLQWLEEVVIGLRLCPWASPALKAGAIDVVIHRGEDLKGLVEVIHTYIDTLTNMPDDSPRNATVLIAVPDMLQDFEDFLDVNQ